jgi:large subunit ribosomal protein L22
MKAKKVSEVVATSKYVRISPLKVRRVLDQIRNRSCNEALLILKFMPQKPCKILSKVISSAMSNAKNNLGWENKSFFISEARVDEGPILKRFCPHAQGRAFPIKKRMSHIVSLFL